ncbi:MAG: hypothetical protein WBC93_07445 [Sulfitobacter sp.]
MQIKRLISVGILICGCGLFGLDALAQNQSDNRVAAVVSDQPLSVIDWLEQNPAPATLTPVGMPKQTEPPITHSGTIPQVTVTELGQTQSRQVGLVPRAVTGLPGNIWFGSETSRVSALLRRLPDLRLPAARSLLFTLLLAEAEGPKGDASQQDIFTLARVAALQRFGALDPAMSLIEQSGPTRDAAHFATYMDLSLLIGSEDAACAILPSVPHLAPSYAHRVFCAARTGHWNDAALMLDTGRAVGVIPDADADLLDRFLHPDAFEDAQPMPTPAKMTPLLFRLHETIGEPLSTRTLSREYAVADLRDLAGWKSQLEAAERLTRVGALPDNRFLGIYTARLPAASGGIWDRVEALQKFETALGTGSTSAVEKTLPSAWRAMQAAQLEVAFATLFADQLTGLTLSGSAGRIAFEMALLSPEYETAKASGQQSNAGLYTAIASGATDTLPQQTDPKARAVISGFSRQAAPADLSDMVAQNRLGETILRTLKMLDDGARGDLSSLTKALGTLRALGLEDTARRAALQVLLIEPIN